MTTSDDQESDTKPLNDNVAQFIEELKNWSLGYSDWEGQLDPRFAERVQEARKVWDAWLYEDKFLIAKNVLEILEFESARLDPPREAADLDERIERALPLAQSLLSNAQIHDNKALSSITLEEWAEAIALYRPLSYNIPGLWHRAPPDGTPKLGRPKGNERAQSAVLHKLLSSAGLTGCSTARDFWHNLQQHFQEPAKAPMKK